MISLPGSTRWGGRGGSHYVALSFVSLFLSSLFESDGGTYLCYLAAGSFFFLFLEDRHTV
jgi:hypothetical protein